MDFMLIMEFKGSLTNCLTTGFRAHPNYGNDVRQQYVQILHEIAKSDLLAYVVSQILGYSITVEKKGKIADGILKSNYALS